MNEFLTALAFSRYKFFLHTSHNPFHVTYLFLYPLENGQMTGGMKWVNELNL